jgi:hypothetical protein
LIVKLMKSGKKKIKAIGNNEKDTTFKGITIKWE